MSGPSGSAFQPARLTIVLAQWCPHCVPLSLRYGRRLARLLGVPLRTLDIDRRGEVRLADRMVRDHGDPAPDYLIPQVFLEGKDGRVEHLLTGFSEQVTRTRRAWLDLIASDRVRGLRGARP
jgi:glutaredoxin